MKITILCSDASHPVNPYLHAWTRELNIDHDISIVRKREELVGGDFLFLVSCSELIKAEHRNMYLHTLVLHASDLPEGRGWSPHIWDIVEGREAITLSLLEAEDQIDSGRIWLKRKIPVEKTALWSDLNHLLFEAEIQLMNEAIVNNVNIKPVMQGEELSPTYRRRRTLSDSRLDVTQSIAAQFDLLRICDPNRYPAWIEIEGCKYKLTLERMDDECN